MSVLKDSPVFVSVSNETSTITNAVAIAILASGGAITIRTADLTSNSITLPDGNTINMESESGNVIADLEIISASGAITAFVTYFV